MLLVFVCYLEQLYYKDHIKELKLYASELSILSYIYHKKNCQILRTHLVVVVVFCLNSLWFIVAAQTLELHIK